jgi:PAS domain S-box-containing protein
VRLTGRSIASVYANRETWSTGLHPDDRERVDAAMRRLDTAPVDVPARVIRADGQLRWIQIRAAIVRDRSGRPYRIAGSFEDVTQIVETRRALEERERELAEALESSEREVAQLHHRLGEHDRLHGLVGSSHSIRMVYRRIRQAAQSEVTVLIIGESGTGKELAANALHALSPRRDRPFVAINCAAIPEPLLESELFGHVRGAFTGASRDKVGLMQTADGGTLFLDEIGDMSPILQAKLLRALQERQIRRVGDETAVPVDVRLVSASHRDLRALVAAGQMREDFYYRIKVFEVDMPPLRDRREDIALLANHFAIELGQAAGKPRLAISADALRALIAHRWPGNVRELRNAIEHALVTVATTAIQLHDLPVEIRGVRDKSVAHEPAAAPKPVTATTRNLREQIEEALRRSGGNRAEAARLIGIGRVTLWKRMRRLGMSTDDTEPDAGKQG